MGTNKKYWKGLEEYHQTPDFLEQSKNEFPEELSVDEFLADDNLKESSTGRRDFLKFLGFSVAAATLAACEAPVVKAVPYVVKPEHVTPGMPTWYASSYYDGSTFANILVKTREGRPIFIKGNKNVSGTAKAINPRVVASVLSLYDGERLQQPTVKGKVADWTVIDANLKSKLKSVAESNGKIVLLSGTEISPSTQLIINEFKSNYNGGSVATEVAEGEMPVATDGVVEHIQYDAVSYSGMRKANEMSFGKAILPDYDFSKAKVIVSVAADFMNSWLMSNEYAAQYASRRNPDGDWMSKHFQFESNMSVAGSNADVRATLKPSQHGALLSVLHKEIVGSSLSGIDTTVLSDQTLLQAKAAAKALKENKGHGLLVAGSNNPAVQTVVNAINAALNNYTSTINLSNPINLFKSEDDKMAGLVKDMNAGKVGAIIMWNTNPVYSYSGADAFKAGLAKVETSVAISQYADETASLCNYIAAENHALESWSDFNPKANTYTLAQPTIRPLFDTRSAADSLMIWAGMASHKGKDSDNFYKYIQSIWEKYGYPEQTKFTDFASYWADAVHNSTAGEADIPAESMAFTGNVAEAARSLAKIKSSDWELTLYQKSSIGNGAMAGNPWLQEMPDSITKVTWDNYITMSPKDMGDTYSTKLGQESPSTVAKVTIGDYTVELPVFPQPGQAHGTIGIALGYGRGANNEKIGKAAYHTTELGALATGEDGKRVSIGANLYPVLKGDFSISDIKIEKTDEVYNLACTQTHSTVMGRNSIVKETTLDGYKSKDASAYNHKHVLHTGWNHEEKPVSEFNLWDEHPVENVGHRWAMTIDLNACNGCGTCLIACQSENNVPVVGKDEVRRGREMHWLRLDRYYASDIEPAVGTKGKEYKEEGFDGLQNPADNPQVVHMPMLCQHCNHAPCETVCPVAATTHSNEGLNMMAYNRCIGTRYCGNNCPYKVRRFNWFDYPSYRKFVEVNPASDDLGRMVLNPDVVVRTRGVMEKCSFCVQKIQAGKLEAKKEDRPLVDGDVSSACADVCPANAITFGDWNNTESEVRHSADEPRAYQALEEIGVKPNIWYKVKVRNEANPALDALQHEHHAPSHDEGHGHGEEAGHDAHATDAHHTESHH